MGLEAALRTPPVHLPKAASLKISEKPKEGVPDLALPPPLRLLLYGDLSLPMKLLLTLLAAASAQVKYGWRDQHVRIHPQLRAKIMEKGRQLKEQNKVRGGTYLYPGHSSLVARLTRPPRACILFFY